MGGEKIIADALDAALARHYEQSGNAEREKQAVVFMDSRWVAIQGGFTPDEILEAVGFIHRYRLSKRLKKSMEDISPFVVKNGEVFIKDALITSGVDVNVNDLIDNAVANAASSATKDIQLAMLYRGENFVGFGVAVGGQLLSQQTDAEIKQHPAARDIAKLHTVFHLKKNQMENPVHIDLNMLR